jgi:hypothetical protein
MTKAAELAKIGEVATNGQIGGRRNIVINGAMQVAQRGNQVTGLGDDNDENYPTVDRFEIAGNAGAGRFTMTQEAVTDLPGFPECIKLDCTTADTETAAAERLFIQTKIEGQDLQAIKKGTSEADAITVSFYAKASASFKFVVALLDVDNNRYAGSTFDVTSSWQRFIVTFPADTDDGSSPFDNDNADSLNIRFFLHGGSNYTSGTLSSTFANTNNTNTYDSNADSFYSSTDNNFFLTGVQLEVGSQATPFEHRSFGEEFQLCQRYYQEVTGSVDNSALGDADQVICPFLAYNTTLGLGIVTFTTPMRGLAAIGFSAVGHFLKNTAGRGDNVTGLALYDATTNATTRTAFINITSGNSTAGGGVMQTQSTAARLNFDAEL